MPKEPYPALTLAYLGDAVFELCAREYIINNHSLTVDEMNKLARGFVSAIAQADMYDYISDRLTPEEAAVLKRGRNAHNTAPKSAGVAQYRRATGLEALFGYLYISGNKERITEIFELCAQNAKGIENADKL